VEPTRTPDPIAPAAPAARRTDLPPAARRWLAHAVSPGSEGLRRAELLMHGEILVGRWRPFRAHQVLDPGESFTWAATAGRGPLAIRGWDRYADGAGQMRWRVLGVPLLRAGGADVSRSAAGRLAGETILSPAFALDPRVRWSPGADDGHAVLRVRIGPWDHEVTLAVDPDGALLAEDMPRWGDPRGGGYGLHGFHVALEGGISQMGITIPRTMLAGWRDADGVVREFLRATIDAATFR
jgi:hypothetical protein